MREIIVTINNTMPKDAIMCPICKNADGTRRYNAVSNDETQVPYMFSLCENCIADALTHRLNKLPHGKFIVVTGSASVPSNILQRIEDSTRRVTMVWGDMDITNTDIYVHRVYRTKCVSVLAVLDELSATGGLGQVIVIEGQEKTVHFNTTRRDG